MAEPCFRFPVVCPECGREEISQMQIAGVAAALLKGEVIQLYASCHEIYWDALPVEVAQLRQYLGIAGGKVQVPPTTISTNSQSSHAVINARSKQRSRNANKARADDLM
jgi:hypothetical protein